MDKVSRDFFFSGFNFLFCFKFQIGKFFWNDGNRYEGEWKDDKKNGQGKKSDIEGFIYSEHCSMLQ